MSININNLKCTGCGKCVSVCPGSLIYLEERKAQIRYPKDCWGCTACIKECRFSAMKYYIGSDIGGRGGYVTVDKNEDNIDWCFKINKKEVKISTNSKQANKY